MERPTVSIIIPAYNCGKTIGRTIDACLNQSYQPNEIIIVDDGSVDETAKIINSYSEVICLRQENAGPAAARNFGAREARGNILMFTDSDCIPHPNWTEKLAAPFAQKDIGAVAGSYGIANEENLLAQCIHAEILFRHKNFMPKFIKAFGSYNCAIRKELFETIGGYDISFRRASGEDNDLSYKILKLDWKIYFEPQGLVDHFHTTSVLKYLKEQFRHGFWRAKLYFFHPAMMRGDDYTYWKDIVETAVSLVIIFTGCLSMTWVMAGSIAIILTAFLLIFEFTYGWIIQKSLFKAVFFSLVMFFRTFARTFGFLAGIAFFSFPSFHKKS